MDARVMALDLGDRRIGVAVSDPLRLFARPLTTIEASGDAASDVAAILKVARDEGAVRIVVGHPLLPSGDRGEQARKVETFAEVLQAATDLPVELWDESYSTVTAHDRLASVGGGSGGSSSGIDAAAAAVILDEWLRAHEGADRGHGIARESDT